MRNIACVLVLSLVGCGGGYSAPDPASVNFDEPSGSLPIGEDLDSLVNRSLQLIEGGQRMFALLSAVDDECTEDTSACLETTEQGIDTDLTCVSATGCLPGCTLTGKTRSAVDASKGETTLDVEFDAACEEGPTLACEGQLRGFTEHPEFMCFDARCEHDFEVDEFRGCLRGAAEALLSGRGEGDVVVRGISPNLSCSQLEGSWQDTMGGGTLECGVSAFSSEQGCSDGNTFGIETTTDCFVR